MATDYRDTEFLVNLHKKFEKLLKDGIIPYDSNEFSLSDEEVVFILDVIEDTLFYERFNGVDYLKEKLNKMKQEGKIK